MKWHAGAPKLHSQNQAAQLGGDALQRRTQLSDSVLSCVSGLPAMPLNPYSEVDVFQRAVARVQDSFLSQEVQMKPQLCRFVW